MLDPATAKRVRLVGLDVDGVLTDAGVYMGMGADGPIELKRFSVQDSIGLKLLAVAGLRLAFISGRYSEATTVRARELGITDVIQDPNGRKLPALEELLRRDGIEMSEVAFVGDDLLDLPVLTRVGLPVAVGNAVPEVLRVAAYTTKATGGHGAVREFSEVLLKSRGEWNQVLTDLMDRLETNGLGAHNAD